MGGDFAPDAVIAGILLAQKELLPHQSLVLFGPQSLIESKLAEKGVPASAFEIIDCPDTIEMAASPVKSIMEKTESSLVKGFDYLKEDKIQGFASAGNTGAMLVGSVLKLGVVRENLRPCLISHVPQVNGGTAILSDVGANADCKPENLVDFAILSSCYAEFVLEIKNPRVGLINIGEEPEKGNALTITTNQLLSKIESLNFIGNIESRHTFTNHSDVLICSGFVGNVMIKLAEGLYEIFLRSGIKSPFLDSMNYESHGGSPILGVPKPVVVAHGISNDNAIKNMIGLTTRMVETQLCTKIKEAIQYA